MLEEEVIPNAYGGYRRCPAPGIYSDLQMPLLPQLAHHQQVDWRWDSGMKCGVLPENGMA